MGRSVLMKHLLRFKVEVRQQLCCRVLATELGIDCQVDVGG
jgi:hypothetical protein